MRISEKCKTCKEKFDSGIWISPQFADEKVLLFCSENFEKVGKSKFSDKNFAQISSGILIPDTFKSKGFEVFGNRNYAKFSSDKCKREYLKMKLNRIKTGYPKYYDRLVKSFGKGSIFEGFFGGGEERI